VTNALENIDWKDLFTGFEGRINRQRFWIGFGTLLAVNIIMQMLIGEQGLVQFIIAILLQIAGIAVCVKRCHDRDKTGWWCLLLLIPVVGIVWAIIDLGILEGTQGPNRYGADPLGETVSG